jgi:hypothetical protein
MGAVGLGSGPKTHFVFRVDIWDHAGDSPQNQNI